MRELSDRENALVAFGREHDINLCTSSPLPFFIHCNDENGRKRPHYKLPADDRELREFARDIGRECCHPKDGTLPDDARPRLFRRGMSPVFVNAETKRLEAMSAELFRTWAGQFVACYCLRYRGAYNEGVIRTMNLDTARGVLASHEFLDQAAQIERLNDTLLPAIKTDGQIELLRPGYFADRRIFTFYDGLQLDEKMSLDEAKHVIDGLLRYFPFSSSRSKAVTIAGMLTMFCVAMLPKRALRPGFIFNANLPGAGKTLLAKMLHYSGRR